MTYILRTHQLTKTYHGKEVVSSNCSLLEASQLR